MVEKYMRNLHNNLNLLLYKKFQYVLCVVVLLLTIITTVNSRPKRKYAPLHINKSFFSRPAWYDSASADAHHIPFIDSSHLPSPLEFEEQPFTQGSFHVPPDAFIPFDISDALIEGKWSQREIETPPSNLHPPPGTSSPSIDGNWYHSSPIIPSTDHKEENSTAAESSTPLSVITSSTNSSYANEQGVESNNKGTNFTEVTVSSNYKISDEVVGIRHEKNIREIEKPFASYVNQNWTSTDHKENSILRLSHSNKSPDFSSDVNSTLDILANNSSESSSDILNYTKYSSASNSSSNVSSGANISASNSSFLSDTDSSTTLNSSTASFPTTTFSDVTNLNTTISSSATISQATLSLDTVNELASLPPVTKVEVTSDSSSVGSNKSSGLNSGAVAGIVIAVLICATLLTSTVIYILYRKFNGKCSSSVESKYNSDNCGYLDDSLRSSVYLNNHIELPKENSEEMTSLDNDSFLNSLETMTIQNYWADNTKNTKV